MKGKGNMVCKHCIESKGIATKVVRGKQRVDRNLADESLPEFALSGKCTMMPKEKMIDMRNKKLVTEVEDFDLAFDDIFNQSSGDDDEDQVTAAILSGMCHSSIGLLQRQQLTCCAGDKCRRPPTSIDKSRRCRVCGFACHCFCCSGISHIQLSNYYICHGCIAKFNCFTSADNIRVSYDRETKKLLEQGYQSMAASLEIYDDEQFMAWVQGATGVLAHRPYQEAAPDKGVDGVSRSSPPQVPTVDADETESEEDLKPAAKTTKSDSTRLRFQVPKTVHGADSTAKKRTMADDVSLDSPENIDKESVDSFGGADDAEDTETDQELNDADEETETGGSNGNEETSDEEETVEAEAVVRPRELQDFAMNPNPNRSIHSLFNANQKMKMLRFVTSFHSKHRLDFRCEEGWPTFDGIYVQLNNVKPNKSGSDFADATRKKRKTMQVTVCAASAGALDRFNEVFELRKNAVVDYLETNIPTRVAERLTEDDDDENANED